MKANVGKVKTKGKRFPSLHAVNVLILIIFPNLFVHVFAIAAGFIFFS